MDKKEYSLSVGTILIVLSVVFFGMPSLLNLDAMIPFMFALVSFMLAIVFFFKGHEE
jgi:hypothetical protein